MMELWITAWIISAVSAAGALWCGRRSGLSWLETLAFGSIFFPAPLFVALGGGNSFIYAFDLVVPLTLYLTARRWSAVPLVAKKAVFWLVLGVGLVPFIVAVTLSNRECILYAGISLYRLTGAMAFLCLLSAIAGELQEGGARLLGAVFWLNMVLVVATLLQSHGWINSNIFYNAEPENLSDDRDSLKFITAGLFRGSLGVIGSVGWVAFLSQFEARGWRSVTAGVGGAAGGLLIILCGSKTSLLAAMFSTVAGCVLHKRVLKHVWLKLVVTAVALATVAGIYLRQMNEDYFGYTLGVLKLSDQSFDTFNYRQERWQEALDLIRRDPMVLIGVSTPFGEERGPAYFHNEYIGVLMSGGLWSAGAYLIGLATLGRGLLRRRHDVTEARVFGGLTLLTAAIQGASVNHIAPGIFFGCTVMMTACAYGVGLGRPSPTAVEDEVEQSEEPGTEPAEMHAAHS
jgi:hypothetical protein